MHTMHNRACMHGRMHNKCIRQPARVTTHARSLLSGAQEAAIPVKLASTIGISVDHRRKNRSLESLQVSWRNRALLSWGCQRHTGRRSGPPSLLHQRTRMGAWACRAETCCTATATGMQGACCASTIRRHGRCRRGILLGVAQENVQRLKAYRSNLVIFPRNVKKPKVRTGSSSRSGGSSGVCRWRQHGAPVARCGPRARAAGAAWLGGAGGRSWKQRLRMF